MSSFLEKIRSGSALPRKLRDGLLFFMLGFFVHFLIDLDSLKNTFGPQGIQTTDYRYLSNGAVTKSVLAEPNTDYSAPLKPMSENQLEFVFTIGLEGTGHHLMQTVLKKSPDFRTMTEWGMTPYLQLALDALFHFGSKGGMWNQACNEEESYARVGKQWKIKPSAEDQTKKATPMNVTNPYLQQGKKIKYFDTMAKHQSLVRQLKHMQQIYDTKTAQNPQPLRIPLSAYRMLPSSGMMSYPNYRGCHKLHYPVLEMLYDACEEAGVECSHVYVHRHPVDVLVSTSLKRSFNSPALVAASHLYTSHLKVIETQLNSFPSRNRGCLGFFDEDEAHLHEWQDTLQRMWGFNPQTYDKLISGVYKRPKHFYRSTSSNIISEEIEGMFPPEHLPYLRVFLKAHERTLAVCRQRITL
jgi:hypothetical protein